MDCCVHYVSCINPFRNKKKKMHTKNAFHPQKSTCGVRTGQTKTKVPAAIRQGVIFYIPRKNVCWKGGGAGRGGSNSEWNEQNNNKSGSFFLAKGFYARLLEYF